MTPTFPVNEVLASHAFRSQLPLQCPRVHREFAAYGVHTALTGRQQPAGQRRDPIGQRRGARKVMALQVLRCDAPGLRIRTLDSLAGQMCG
jgi:hypothetical protein